MIIDMNILLFSLFLIFMNYLIILNRELIANKLKINDYPDDRKIHNTPTPMIGGLCIFFTLLILNYSSYISNILNTKDFLILSSFYFLFFLIGFWDDIKQLSPKLRTLIIIIIIVTLLLLDKNYIIQDLRFKYASSIDLGSFAFIFTIFCFFALYNALNFVDGYNGVSLSITIYWSIFLLFSNLNIKYFYIILILFLIYLYNLRGKLFLGNSGTSILTIFFCLSLIGDYNLTNKIFADEILCLLFFPGIDMIRVTLQRFFNKKKIYTADKSHFHHYLLNNNYKYIWQTMLFLSVLPLAILNFTSNTHSTLIISIIIYTVIFLFLKKNKVNQSK